MNGDSITTLGNEDRFEVRRKDNRPLRGGFAIVLEAGDPDAWTAITAWINHLETQDKERAEHMRRVMNAVSGFNEKDVSEQLELDLLGFKGEEEW